MDMTGAPGVLSHGSATLSADGPLEDAPPALRAVLDPPAFGRFVPASRWS